MKQEKYHIEYLGKSIDSIYHKNITDEEREEIKREYYKKPNFSDVASQFKKINQGGTKHDLVDRYYIKDLMSKVTRNYCKWSIEDVLNNNELLGMCIAKVEASPKAFPPEKGLAKNIETWFRIGGKGIATKVSNFPLKAANEILENYNVNNNFYDFSCGWGTRLLSSLKNNINYFGTDPNTDLCLRLKNLSSDYKKVCSCNSDVEIRSCGSEVFIPEWENKMGIAFSSPPYYCLEDYKIGKQSYVEGISYKQWLDGYMDSTIKNIYKYLIKDGKFLINVNDFDQYKLTEDICSIAEKDGFSLIGTYALKNITRNGGAVGWNGECKPRGNNETIFIFSKKMA